MTTIAEQLRAAALGPTPRAHPSWGRVIGDWLPHSPVGTEAFLAAHRWRDLEQFSALAVNEQRMFLLFVAEAEESETA